ncbi:methylated-DNA-protein-cysteine methyltransferase [Nitzschia inconspicua]|uniref:Methylated-DNA--protein-cysteine methyltransferase n=1 Tax=Nitzschia inconspicua TaxID=303405 RepID=A0A9K3LCX0_9STRA|nr:methylated-DNA-protein-cysteine methyltransferase [Nitzschia inconspicua]
MKNLALTAVQKETLSPFQIKVYEACMQIPNGKVATYKGIADAIHCRSSQAVGQALKRNPYNGANPSVPCHRVIKSDLSVGGFAGSYDNLNKKKLILEEEGVVVVVDVKGSMYVNEQHIFTFN